MQSQNEASPKHLSKKSLLQHVHDFLTFSLTMMSDLTVQDLLKNLNSTHCMMHRAKTPVMCIMASEALNKWSGLLSAVSQKEEEERLEKERKEVEEEEKREKEKKEVKEKERREKEKKEKKKEKKRLAECVFLFFF